MYMRCACFDIDILLSNTVNVESADEKYVLNSENICMWLEMQCVFVSCLYRPEKSKMQIIPGQLNITIECVPPDLSSKSDSSVWFFTRLHINLSCSLKNMQLVA